MVEIAKITVTTYKIINISCLSNNILQKNFLKVTFLESILQANGQYNQNIKKQMESMFHYNTIY